MKNNALNKKNNIFKTWETIQEKSINESKGKRNSTMEIHIKKRQWKVRKKEHVSPQRRKERKTTRKHKEQTQEPSQTISINKGKAIKKQEKCEGKKEGKTRNIETQGRNTTRNNQRSKTLKQRSNHQGNNKNKKAQNSKQKNEE